MCFNTSLEENNPLYVFLMILFKPSKNDCCYYFFRHSQAQSSPKGCDVFTRPANKVARHLDYEIIACPSFRLDQVRGRETCPWLLGWAMQT